MLRMHGAEMKSPKQLGSDGMVSDMGCFGFGYVWELLQHREISST